MNNQLPPLRHLIIVAAIWLMVPTVCIAADAQITEPLTLKQALQMALEGNPSVAASKNDVRSSVAGLYGQEARREPTLNAGWDWQTQKSLERSTNVGGGTIQTGGGRNTTRQLTLTLQETFLESGRQEAIDSAQAQVQANKADLTDVRRQLLQQVATTYHSVLANQELHNVAQEAVDAAELHLEMVDAMIDAEKAAPVDRLDVEAELADARYERVNTRNAVEQSLADMRELLALPSESSLSLAGAPDTDYTRGELDSWLEHGMSNRSDLLARRHSVRVAELNVEQAKIAAGLTYRVFGQGNWGDYNEASGTTWSLGASVSYPLHDRKAKADVDRAQTDLQAARHRLDNAKNAVSREIAKAWYALGNATERVTSARKSVAAAKSNLEAARQRYWEDLADIVEVTDAEVDWRRARGQLVQARYDRSAAYYTLVSASGRLLTEANTGEQSYERDERAASREVYRESAFSAADEVAGPSRGEDEPQGSTAPETIDRRAASSTATDENGNPKPPIKEKQDELWQNDAVVIEP